MPTRWVVDRVLPSAGGPALQIHQFRDQSVMVQQLDTLGIEQGEKIPIQVRLERCGCVVPDALLLQLLAGPFACISVAGDVRNAVVLEQGGELLHHRFRAEGGFRDRIASTTTISRSWGAIARVMVSSLTLIGSTNP